MPLSPQEAVSRISEQVTVEILVKAAKNCQRCPLTSRAGRFELRGK
jgi:hypothetical protein